MSKFAQSNQNLSVNSRLAYNNFTNFNKEKIMAIDFSKTTVTNFLPSKGGERSFTKEEKDEIIAVMQNAYNRSRGDSEIRKMFEDWVIKGGKKYQ